jgi:hypothetical protein
LPPPLGQVGLSGSGLGVAFIGSGERGPERQGFRAAQRVA